MGSPRPLRIVRTLPTLALALVASPALAQSSFAEGTEMTWDGALTGVFFGLLIFSVTYNAAFFALLRERFLIWQSARSIIYLALVVGLSPLAMGAFLSPESFARQVYINLLFDLGVAITGPVLRAYLEPGMIGPRMYRALGWLAPAVMLTTPAMLIADCPPIYMAFRNIVMVTVLVLCIAAVAQAWRNGSRTARYQVLAWSAITSVYGISLFYDIVLGRPFEYFLFALFPALGLETMLTALGMLDRLHRLRAEREEARATANALHLVAHTDPLTGLANRRAIEAQFDTHRPVAVALVDLDHFKRINDRHGHDVGDRVIAAAGAALASGKATAARIGGEEFALLLYDSVVLAAVEAESLRRRIAHHVATTVSGIDEPVTASMGLAMVCEGTSFAAAMKAADINLYAAKDAGRDRTVTPVAIAA